MEDTVTMLLPHLGVDVVAGVAQIGDLLGQELHSLDWVAEDYRLVDLKLSDNIRQERTFVRRYQICSNHSLGKTSMYECLKALGCDFFLNVWYLVYNQSQQTKNWFKRWLDAIITVPEVNYHGHHGLAIPCTQRSGQRLADTVKSTG